MYRVHRIFHDIIFLYTRLLLYIGTNFMSICIICTGYAVLSYDSDFPSAFSIFGFAYFKVYMSQKFLRSSTMLGVHITITFLFFSY